MPISHLRKEYSQASLSEQDAALDPMAQFAAWFDDALAAQLPDPNTMTLATCGADGQPSARIVLLKGFGPQGFTWFTNYQSRKAYQLEDNARASLLFYWSELERQVSVEGSVVRLPDEDNDAYFLKRPVSSRLGAIASAQSQPVSDRATLEAKFAHAATTYGDTPPRPPHWGGYRMLPERIEFWQGRCSRLHDRLVYTLHPNGQWLRERLQP